MGALSIVSCLCLVPGVKDLQLVIIEEVELQFLLSVISLTFSVTILIEKILCRPLNKHKKEKQEMLNLQHQKGDHGHLL